MKLKKTVACLFSMLIALSAVACTTPGGTATNSGSENLDTERTQLYVFNYDGGYGSEWLSKAKASYEELYKDTSFEDGKKGIQIVINNSKTKREGAAILTNTDEIYFTEGIQYYQSINDNAFADISKAVTGENPYESGKTIESKMETSQKEFFKYPTSDGGVYYAIPHYSGCFGIVYDIDLFDAKGLYFKDGYSATAALETCFTYEDSEKTAGPDNVKGTSDDGLPVTYDEFFMLCEYICGMNMTPIVWSGEHYTGYMTMLLNQMIVNDAGIDEALLTYTMDGTASNLGTVDESGNFVKDSSATTITADNAYELYRSESKYYALEAIEKLLRTDKYHNSTAFTGTHSHLQAQDDFLWSGKDGQTTSIAMLADGIWWQSEANNTFTQMADGVDAQYSKENRNFGWMPLPRSSADKAGQKNVYFDHLYSMCFVKKNIADWKLDIAIDFIQYVHTDAAMVEFSKTTNTPKAYNYTLSSSDLSALTPFGRSLMEYKQNADVLYPLSMEPLFLNNQLTFAAAQAYATTLGSLEYGNPAQVFHEKSNVTAAEYFVGMYTHYKSEWATLK